MRILAAGFALGPHVNEIIASAKAHVRSLADLKGKTIAVNQLGAVGMDLVLQRAGLLRDQTRPGASRRHALPGHARRAGRREDRRGL